MRVKQVRFGDDIDEAKKMVLHEALDKGNEDATIKAKMMVMHRAVDRGDQAVFYRELGNGADICERDETGGTLLHRAAYHDHQHIAAYLIENAPDIISAINAKKETPLHIAAKHGHTDIAQRLINAGADKYARDNKYNTPLEVAIRNGYNEVMQSLLKADKEKKYLITPLKIAQLSGNHEAIQLLKKHDHEEHNRLGRYFRRLSRFTL